MEHEFTFYIKDVKIFNGGIMKRQIDKPEDVKMQEYIEARANYSVSILGQAFVRNGSGSFLNIRRVGSPKRVVKKNSFRTR